MDQKTCYDVIVVGGGPAGTAAAISAGRAGAKVLLIEKENCLGGMSTAGFVNPLFDHEPLSYRPTSTSATAFGSLWPITCIGWRAR